MLASTRVRARNDRSLDEWQHDTEHEDAREGDQRSEDNGVQQQRLFPFGQRHDGVGEQFPERAHDEEHGTDEKALPGTLRVVDRTGVARVRDAPIGAAKSLGLSLDLGLDGPFGVDPPPGRAPDTDRD